MGGIIFRLSSTKKMYRILSWAMLYLPFKGGMLKLPFVVFRGVVTALIKKKFAFHCQISP
jgi:hypothetical protein